MWLHRENCTKDPEWSASRGAGEPIRHRNMYLVSFTWATHWVQHEEPERVNRLLVEFLAGGGGR